MYKHHNTQYMYKHELELFKTSINGRSIMTPEEWGKFRDEKVDIGIVDKEIDIDAAVLDLDYSEFGLNMNNMDLNSFKGANVGIWANVEIRKDPDKGDVRVGNRCYPPATYDNCKKFIGKQIFLISDTVEEIPANSVIFKAQLYVKGMNEEYRKRLEAKKLRDEKNKYFDKIKEAANELDTPWIHISKNERNVEKYLFEFEFMDEPIRIIMADKVSSIIASNYIFELDANNLFQGKLEFRNLRFINIERKLGTSLDEYMKMRNMSSLDNIYNIVKNNIYLAAKKAGLLDMLSKDLKNFISVEVNKKGEIIDSTLIEFAKSINK